MGNSTATASKTPAFTWNWLICIAKGFSFIVFVTLRYGLRYRYRTIVTNLTNAFPGQSAQQYRKLTNAYYRHMSDLCVEPFLFFFASARQRAQLARFTNPHLLSALHQAHRPVVLLASHYGNWEYLARLPQLTDYPVYTAYSPLKNRWLDQVLIRLRSHLGMRMIPKQSFYRQALTVLQQPDDLPLLLLIADQRPGPGSAKYQLPFLHQDTAVQTGAERMAVLSNAAVVNIEARQTARFQYQFTFRLLCEQASRTAPMAITRQYYQALERIITQAPMYWLWSHNRWKNRATNLV
ncbi:lysophospholipid acyltransferase family protein [Spirosoma fluminis]